MPPRRQQQFFIFLAPGASSLFIMNNSLPRISYGDYHTNYENF